MGRYLAIDPDEPGIRFDTFIGRHDVQVPLTALSREEMMDSRTEWTRGTRGFKYVAQEEAMKGKVRIRHAWGREKVRTVIVGR